MDDIVLFCRNTIKAKIMLKGLNEAGRKFGLRINRKKEQFMKEVYSKGEGMLRKTY